MLATDKTFAGSVPAIYDRYMVPLIFVPFAIEVAERVSKLAPIDILETAAGTGVVTEELAKRLPKTRIVATDLNPGMLNVAAKKITAANVSWQQADATKLPFGDASFDVVVCQFGVMFFPDKLVGYREALRVLKPGGAFIFAVWDRIEASEMADEVMKAVAVVFPDDPPQFIRRTPHGCFDTDVIRKGLTEAGFGNVGIDKVAKKSRSANHRDPAIAFCQGTPLRGEIEARDKDRLEAVTDAAAAAIARRFGEGPCEGGMVAILVTARK